MRLVGETEEKLSFGELRARSNQVANHLRALGVKRGDRVLLVLPNMRQLWEAMLALMKLGAVIIPATTLLTESDLATASSGAHPACDRFREPHRPLCRAFGRLYADRRGGAPG